MINTLFLISYCLSALLLFVCGIKFGKALSKKKYENIVSLQILDETGEKIAFKYMGKDEYIANISKKVFDLESENQKLKNKVN